MSKIQLNNSLATLYHSNHSEEHNHELYYYVEGQRSVPAKLTV